MRRSKWITATSGTVYEPKEASEAEVESYLNGQKTATVVGELSTTGQYMVARNKNTGQLLFSGEGCLSAEYGWEQLFVGSCQQCLEKVKEIKSGVSV